MRLPGPAPAEEQPAPTEVRRRRPGVPGGEHPFVRGVVAEFDEHLCAPLRRHGAHLGALLVQVANCIEKQIRHG
jgi:hypothetical protein